FGAWIMFIVSNNLIIGTETILSKWLDREPCPFKLSVFFFVMFTLQVQDFRDQKGDSLIGRKTLPILIGDVACRRVVPWEFIIIEIILFIVAMWTCVRLIKYRNSDEDRKTYEL
ncbi:19670_t:CDS:2, partial [Racocetra persica]